MRNVVEQQRPVEIMRLERVLDRLESRGLRGLVDSACAETGISITEVIGRRRFASITRARHMLWFWLYRETGLSYPEIGRIFEVDHTTVLAAVHKIAREHAMPVFKRAQPIIALPPVKCGADGSFVVACEAPAPAASVVEAIAS